MLLLAKAEELAGVRKCLRISNMRRELAYGT
jgi:hypothetical protein